MSFKNGQRQLFPKEHHAVVTYALYHLTMERNILGGWMGGNPLLITEAATKYEGFY